MNSKSAPAATVPLAAFDADDGRLTLLQERPPSLDTPMAANEPLANDRLSLSDEGTVHLAFKRPWSDGTSAVTLEPLALISRLAALVPPPKRHTVRYFGVLSSHSASRSLVVPKTTEPQVVPAADAAKAAGKSRYIPWAELLRRTFAIEIKCAKCGSRLRLRALIQTAGRHQEDPSRDASASGGARAASGPSATRTRRAGGRRHGRVGELIGRLAGHALE